MVKDYDDMSKDTSVSFVIQFHKGVLQKLESSVLENQCNGVEKLLKLYSTSSTNNMHLFDHEDKLRKYNTIADIIDDYYPKRLEMYATRKEYIIGELTKDVQTLSNKYRYIQELLNDAIDLRHKTKDAIDEMLAVKGYAKSIKENDYKYLTRMPMDSVSVENSEKLKRESEDRQAELDKVQSTTIQEMWLIELEALQSEYVVFKENHARMIASEPEDTAPPKKMVKKIKKNVVVKK